MNSVMNKIWNVADRIRMSGQRISLPNILAGCKEDDISIGIPELSVIAPRFEYVHFVPVEVTNFIGQILQPHHPKKMLDPWAGLGFLSIPLSQSLTPTEFAAYSKNEQDVGAWEQIEGGDGVSLYHADALHALPLSDDTFDAVVSCPPWGLNSREPLSVEVEGKTIDVKDDYGHLLMLESCRHLVPDGLAVFVTYGGFFERSGRPGKARHTLSRMGIRPVAAFELPPGTFAPLTSITTHIVVLKRSDSDLLFTGRYTADPKQQKVLLKQFRDQQEGKSAELGRIVSIESFRGFTPIELDERVRESAKRIGLVGYAFTDVVKEVNLPSSKSEETEFEARANAVYLPQMGATAAQIDQGKLPDKLKSYFQLIVDPEVADAEFVAGLFNTSFGQLWRDSLRTGSTIARINKSSLETSTLFLPPKESREIQGRVLDCQQRISRLKNEVNELESQLWKRPAAVNKIEAGIEAVNREDRFEDWLDSLPFPLASILWSCHTQSGSLKEQYERKIHFFEALSEFMGILLLSAFSANDAVWGKLQEKLKGAMKQGNLSFDRATFGTWKAVVETLSADARKLLHSDENLVFELFKTRNRDLLNAVLSKKIVSLFQQTNKIRNDWQGHTGIVPDRDAKNVNDTLQRHIETVREIFGVSWEGYELLIPGSCKLRSGEFVYSVKKVMGTRTPFPTDSVSVSEAMEDGHLYLKSPDESRGMKLLPLIKVMRSPRTEENACYFYNRRQAEGIRFLSYYFEADAEVVAEFDDVSIALTGLINMDEAS